MTKLAIGKLPLPDEDFDVRDRMSRTIPGVGDCPQRDGCMLEVANRIEILRQEIFAQNLQTQRELGRVTAILEQWIGAKGIKNTDSTPATAPKGQAEIKTKDVRVRAPVWATLALAVLLVVAVAIWQIEEIAKLFK